MPELRSTRPTSRTGSGLRLLSAVTFAGMISVPVYAQETSNFSDAERTEIKNLVREYLLENPDIITEVVDLLQAKDQAQRQEQQKTIIADNKTALFSPMEETIIGNPEGDVTLVEFFDYNCGYCKSMFEPMMEVVQADGNVRLVMKEFPILGAPSMTATRAALASRKQGKYQEFHIALLSHRSSLNEVAIFEIAEDVGLDRAKLEEDMKSTEIDTIITANHELARSLNISGTPALIVNDTFVPGAIGKEELEKLIADARQ